MYLNFGKFLLICIYAGGATLFSVILGLIGLVINYNDPHYFDITVPSIIVCEMGAFILFCFFWDAIRAYRINRIFSESEEGLLDIEEVAKQLKMKHYKFVVVFHRLVGRRLLINCSVFPEDPTCIILANEKYDIRSKFIVHRCKNCAAPNTLRIGFERECKYCGANIL